MKTRVVVTGIGVLAANGSGIGPFWESMLASASGIGPITLFDASNFPLQIAGEVKGFDLSNYTNGRFKPKRLGRHTQLAIAATHLAIEDAKLDRATLVGCAPFPVNIGVSTSAIDIVEYGMDRLATRGPSKVSPYIVTSGLPHATTYTVVESLGIDARATTISSACQGGMDAIAAACLEIRSGKTDIAIAGGTDSPITPLTVASFCASGLVPSFYDDPKKASRPFDRNRAGGIIAESACILVLESLDHALLRGRTPYIEIRGFCSNGDTPNAEPASGLPSAMRGALANAGWLTHEVGYICAHGPSEPIMDRVETQAIKDVLGDHAYRIPISSIKGVTGNPLAAQGPLQVATCALAVQNDTLPPTANYEYPDPECDLDYVPKRPRHSRVNRMLVNVHGLGGGNTCMALERVNVE